MQGVILSYLLPVQQQDNTDAIEVWLLLDLPMPLSQLQAHAKFSFSAF